MIKCTILLITLKFIHAGLSLVIHRVVFQLLPTMAFLAIKVKRTTCQVVLSNICGVPKLTHLRL